MIVPIVTLYQLIEKAKPLFEDRNLNGTFFMDLYNGQPLDPEMHEYYNLPAIFVDYLVTGQGIGHRRKIEMTLHLVLAAADHTGSISDRTGLQRLLYPVLIQMALEGKRLGNTTALVFESESKPESDLTHYHTLVFSFESDLQSLIEVPDWQWGAFENMTLKGALKQKRK